MPAAASAGRTQTLCRLGLERGAVAPGAACNGALAAVRLAFAPRPRRSKPGVPCFNLKCFMHCFFEGNMRPHFWHRVGLPKSLEGAGDPSCSGRCPDSEQICELNGQLRMCALQRARRVAGLCDVLVEPIRAHPSAHPSTTSSGMGSVQGAMGTDTSAALFTRRGRKIRSLLRRMRPMCACVAAMVCMARAIEQRGGTMVSPARLARNGK